MFRRSASLAIPHRKKSFAAIPSLSLGSLGTRIAASSCHTNRSVKLPLFRHFQDQFLITNKEKWGEEKWAYVSQGLCFFKNLLMPLFLMGCFPVDFQEVKRPLGTKSVKRPIKVGKQPINEGKRPIKAKVLVGVSVGCLMGCFRAPPPWRKTAPLKRPIKRSMIFDVSRAVGIARFESVSASLAASHDTTPLSWAARIRHLM